MDAAEPHPAARAAEPLPRAADGLSRWPTTPPAMLDDDLWTGPAPADRGAHRTATNRRVACDRAAARLQARACPRPRRGARAARRSAAGRRSRQRSDVPVVAGRERRRATGSSYLMRPDLGRRLAAGAEATLARARRPIRRGVRRHRRPVGARRADARGSRCWPACCRRCAPKAGASRRWSSSATAGSRSATPSPRLLGADCVAVLIGERPGLTAPDSMGAYLTWQPQPGTTDADRNCISNIRPDGIGYADAALKLAHMLRAMRARRISGVQLKDDSDRLLVGATIEAANLTPGVPHENLDRPHPHHAHRQPAAAEAAAGPHPRAARRATPSTPPPSRPRPPRRSTRSSRSRSRTASTSSATAR